MKFETRRTSQMASGKEEPPPHSHAKHKPCPMNLERALP